MKRWKDEKNVETEDRRLEISSRVNANLCEVSRLGLDWVSKKSSEFEYKYWPENFQFEKNGLKFSFFAIKIHVIMPISNLLSIENQNKIMWVYMIIAHILK